LIFGKFMLTPHDILATIPADHLALLEKYSRPGPRYTSYPTAPHFHEGINNEAWEQELQHGRNLTRPLSLYFHLPFCDTLCYFCGCNMIATHRYHRVPPYLQTLRREMEKVVSAVGQHRLVRQLHWGGGTPTFLKPEDIRLLAGWIRELFGQQGKYSCDENGAENAEIGCEIDPRELSFEHLQALRESGFNRVSFGVQDLDHTVQQAVNRIQPEAMVRQVYQWARELGFSSINLDLMTGLPHQTVDGFAKTLEVILELAPDRLAVFAYAHLPQMIRHQSLIPDASLPDFNTRLALQMMVRQRLSAAGYINIGMDHYAKPSDEMVIAQKTKRCGAIFRDIPPTKIAIFWPLVSLPLAKRRICICKIIRKLTTTKPPLQNRGLPPCAGSG
jgi:oxygen-independent coproporphyrinogen-3 oxidase